MTDLLGEDDIAFEPAPEPDEKSFSLLARMADRLVVLQEASARAAAAAAELAAQVRQLEEYDLPRLMAEIGMAEFTLTDGTAIAVKTRCHASLNGSNHDEGVRWLVDHGHADLVRHSITVGFGKAEQARAAEALALIAARFPEATVSAKETVNSQTLAALVREEIREGRPVPTEPLGVYLHTYAKVNRPA